MWREGNAESDGVVVSGSTTFIDCKDTLLRATSNQEVVGIGLEDLVVVAMPDAVLVAHKDRVQDVKTAVQLLKTKGVSQAETCPATTGPGAGMKYCFRTRFQVKRIG